MLIGSGGPTLSRFLPKIFLRVSHVAREYFDDGEVAATDTSGELLWYDGRVGVSSVLVTMMWKFLSSGMGLSI